MTDHMLLYYAIEFGKAALLCGFGIAVAAIVANAYTKTHYPK